MRRANEAGTSCGDIPPPTYFCARVMYACRRTHVLKCLACCSQKAEQTAEDFRGQAAKMTSKRDAALHPCRAVLRAASSSSKSFPELILIMSVMLLVPVRPASAHPQCLDFAPPFRPPWHLEFCTQYEEFGCCDQKADNVIAERYWDIIEQLEVAGLELCSDKLKEVMCQVDMFFFSLS